MALEKISEKDLAAQDVRAIRPLLQKLAVPRNALLNVEIILNSQRNLCTLDEEKLTLELNIPAAVAAATTSAVFPFDLIAPASRGNTATVYGQVNPFSLFVPDVQSTDTMDVSGLGEDVELSPGIFYLQVDASDDASGVDGVSVVHNTAGFGNKNIIVSGSGEDGDPYLWSRSCLALAQVYACSRTAQHGGRVFASGDGSAFVEVVNECSSHLGLVVCATNGVLARRVVKTAASFG